MTNLNEQTSVLAAILTDHSDKNFPHILSANKCQQQIRMTEHLKQTKHQTKSQFVYKQTHESRD